MPKATVNKDDGLMFCQYDVRFSGKPDFMDPETVPVTMQKTSDEYLWFLSLLRTRLMFQLRFALDMLSVNQIISSIA